MSARICNASLASCLGLAFACGVVAEAQAGGFALREENAEGVGSAFAGQSAKAYDASTVYYNPAGMARLDSSEVQATASWIAPTAQFSGSNSSVVSGDVSGNSDLNAIKAAAIGSAFGVWNASPDWKFGFSVAVPFGMRADYKPDWVGRYQALASDVTDIDFSLLASYRVNDHLSFGAGPRIDYLKARLSEAINFNAIGLQAASQYAAGARAAQQAAQQYAAAGQTQQAAQYAAQATALGADAQTTSQWGDGLGMVDGDDYGYGYTLGALYEFNRDTRIGLNYRSRSSHTLSGKASYQTPSSLALAGPTAALFMDQNASAKITLPDSLNLGFFHAINERWDVMATAEWTHWSLFKTLNIVGDNGQAISSTNENWQDTWFLSLGGNYKVDDRWTLHSGIAFDQSPVKDQYRTARIPDANRYWLSGGVSCAVTPAADLHFGYAHLFADKASINETANSLAGVLSGTYKNSANIFSATVAMRI